MADYQALHFDRKGDVLCVTIDHPSSELNTIDELLHGELTRVFRELKREDAARAILLTGRGRAFSGGGDFGWLKRGAISKVFSDKVFALAEGVTTEPFESPFGFHVVVLLEPPRKIRKTFESVKGDIRYQLGNRAKDAELERLLETVEIEIL